MATPAVSQQHRPSSPFFSPLHPPSGLRATCGTIYVLLLPVFQHFPPRTRRWQSVFVVNKGSAVCVCVPFEPWAGLRNCVICCECVKVVFLWCTKVTLFLKLQKTQTHTPIRPPASHLINQLVCVRTTVCVRVCVFTLLEAVVCLDTC